MCKKDFYLTYLNYGDALSFIEYCLLDCIMLKPSRLTVYSYQTVPLSRPQLSMTGERAAPKGLSQICTECEFDRMPSVSACFSKLLFMCHLLYELKKP